MRRKQLYISEETDRGLKRLSARTGRSEASCVRDALDQFLGSQPPSEDDPLERLIGLVSDADGPNDLAEHHDHYLYGVPKKPQSAARKRR